MSPRGEFQRKGEKVETFSTLSAEEDSNKDMEIRFENTALRDIRRVYLVIRHLLIEIPDIWRATNHQESFVLRVVVDSDRLAKIVKGILLDTSRKLEVERRKIEVINKEIKE